MTNTEILRLPEIPEGPAETQLQAIKTYLYRLAEQLQYILSAEKQERLQDRQDYAAYESRVVRSPRLAQQVLALSDRRMQDRYVPGDAYERDRQRQEELIWSLRDRTNEAPMERPTEGSAFRVEGRPGWQVREEERIRFYPMDSAQPFLTRSRDGHWRSE